MADYYAILKRAIGALPEPTGEVRRAVYEKARTALVNQLKAFDPPLTASEITQQRLQLEDAIRKVEAEAAKGILKSALDRAAAQQRPAVAPPAPQPPYPQPTGQPPASPMPAPGAPQSAAPQTFTPPPSYQQPAASQPAPQPTSSFEPPQLSAPAPRPSLTPPGRPQTGAAAQPAAEMPRPAAPAPGPVGMPAGPVADHAAAQSDFAVGMGRASGRDTGVAAGTAALVADAPTRDAAQEPVARTEDTAGASPLRRSVSEAGPLGMAAAEASRHARDVLAAPDTGMVPPDTKPAEKKPFMARRAKAPAEPKPSRERRRAGAGLEAEATPRRSKLPLLVGFLVALLVVAIGGAVVWTQREAITAYLDKVGARPQTTNGEKLAPKSNDRLGADDSGAPAKPPGATVKSVQTQTVTPPAETPTQTPDSAQSQPPQQQANAGGSATAPSAGSPATTMPSTPPAVPSTPVPPVAQKAVLYEEGTNGQTQAQVTQGRVVWQVTRENTDPTKPPVTLLKARVEIPERNISLNIVMHPNADQSFPASHLIEMKFMTPPDFDGKSIVNVPGMIMKNTEQDRGEPLTGASAKVSNGYFWIALGANPADRTKNLSLIKDRGWIDIPILYETNRRAILTLEKVGAGDRVVADAFSAWGQGG
ncbi:hypothetical protein [Methyloraptor flagellatus]|uniref:Transcriptional regulator n=1 Tax=Methyloraptor flagellatus TaxID=3162530 RepID=A0AAU7X9X5_9HYPH